MNDEFNDDLQDDLEELADDEDRDVDEQQPGGYGDEEPDATDDDPMFPDLNLPNEDAQVEAAIEELGLSQEQLDKLTSILTHKVTKTATRQQTIDRILTENIPAERLARWRPALEASTRTLPENITIEPWVVYGSAYVAALQSMPKKQMSLAQAHAWIGKQLGLMQKVEPDAEREFIPAPERRPPTVPKGSPPQKPTPKPPRYKSTGDLAADSLRMAFGASESDLKEILKRK